MEETKELQTLYKIFRYLIYTLLLLEFFEYAIDPAILDHWGGIVCDVHDRIKRWFIYNDGNLVWSKVAIFVAICIVLLHLNVLINCHMKLVVLLQNTNNIYQSSLLANIGIQHRNILTKKNCGKNALHRILKSYTKSIWLNIPMEDINQRLNKRLVHVILQQWYMVITIILKLLLFVHLETTL